MIAPMRRGTKGFKMTASARYDDGGYSGGSTARPDANVSRGRRQRGRRIHVLHSGDGGTIPPLKVCSFGQILDRGHLGRPNPSRTIMVIQIVINHTGDSRHHSTPAMHRKWRTRGAAFWPDQCRLHRRGRKGPESDLADPIVRPHCGRNPLLPQAGRRVVAFLLCSAFDRRRRVAAPA